MCNMTPGKTNIGDILAKVIRAVCSVYEEGFIYSSDMTIHWKGHLSKDSQARRWKQRHLCVCHYKCSRLCRTLLLFVLAGFMDMFYRTTQQDTGKLK